MDLDLQEGLARPSAQNLLKVAVRSSELLRLRQTSVRYLLSFLGLLNHVAQLVHLGRLRLRRLQFFVKAKAPVLKDMLDLQVELDDHFRKALLWWLEQDNLTTGVPFLSYIPLPVSGYSNSR